VKKLVLFCLSLILLSTFYFLPSVTPAYAADNFTTAYNVIYTVDEAGITHVLMKVGLTNTSSQYYASSYKINVGFDDITNIKVTDPNGEVKPKLEKTEEGHAIAVTFNKKVVGKGNTLPFTVTFDTKDIAHKRGSIWSLNIPGIADQDAFSDFTVRITVPNSFGKAAYIKPEQRSDSLTFTKAQLGKGGISIAFGEKQAYDFYLTYHLRNNNVFPIRTEIALPPTTNYQEVLYTSIEPEPVNVTQDKDGNWLAVYNLKPSEKFDVIARGKAYLTLTPKKEVTPDEELAEFLQEKEYWQVSHEEIKTLAAKLKTPEAIYAYVVDTLQYDFSRVTDSKARVGAAGVLKNPTSAVCLEFTDLFIAIARAAGIPAREVNGYAYTENDKQRPLSLVKDILHAWPEYYDQERQTWVMIDPTWGNTTGGIDYFSVLDFDHFTFVRKGHSSTYPIPAGGYKYSESDEGIDVHVEFGRIEQSPLTSVTILPGFTGEYWSFLRPSGTVRVRNISQGLLKPQTLHVASDTLIPVRSEIELGAIPPNGVVEVPVSFEKLPFLTNAAHTFTIQVANASLKQSIEIVPVIFPGWPAVGGIVFGILIIIICIFAYKSGRLPFFRRK
jgi:transglutaminase-like putative cysteine protease